MNKTQIFKAELLKFLLAVILALLVSHYAFSSYFRDGSLDIHFHDTYVVVDTIGFGLILFSPVYYLVQLLHLSFARRMVWASFILFLFSALLLLCVLYQLHLFFLLFKNTNEVVWQANPGMMADYSDFKYIYWVILFILLSVIWICIKFGRQKRKCH